VTQPQERPQEDAFWEGVVDRVDFEVSSAELDRAEQLLKGAAAEAHSGGHEVAAPPALRVVHRPKRRWMAVAAAVVVVSVPVAYLIYTGTLSVRDMTLPMAVAVLEDPTQPERVRSLAIGRAADHVFGAITVLKRLEAEGGDLKRWAVIHLETMAMTLDLQDPPAPSEVDDRMRESMDVANDAQQPPNRRLPAMEHVASLARSAMLAIQRMPVEEDDSPTSVSDMRRRVLAGFHAALKR
jgi:hypothetical protein